MRRKWFRAKPFADWPQADRHLWLAGTEGACPLDGAGAGARWRPVTKVTVRNAYGMALQWLDSRGWLAASARPAERWSRSRLSAYVDDMINRVGLVTVFHRVVNLERALAVLEPQSDRAILRSAIAKLAPRARKSSKRAQLQDPADLVDFGFRLMDMADKGYHSNARRNATIYRVGLQVALLAMRPLRMRNFSAIRIGHHLVQERHGWQLLFEGSETKNHRPIQVLLPDELRAPMHRYIGHYRRLLMGTQYAGDRLWVSYRFQSQSAHTMQLAIVRVTRDAFGLPVNPHLFRDCAATSIAIHDPQAVRIAATILGHASFSTTEKHYNLARSLDAGRSYAKHVDAVRKGEGGKVSGRRKL